VASTLPTFRTQLKTALEANGVISAANVKVHKYLKPNVAGDHYIEFTRAQIQQEYQAQDKRKEMYALRVNIRSRIPGKGDDKAATAETNVLAWVDVIAAEIKADKTMGGSVAHCEWSGGELDNQTDDEGRWAYMVGSIAVIAFNV
jgi:hypothetical protein